MQVQILDIHGKNTKKKVELIDKVFNINPNDHAIWLDIRSIGANQHQGTHASKNRSKVSGGGKKPFRQKGTGRARVGTRRNPVWTGGGIAFGPKPRDTYYTIPKKLRKRALRDVLILKFLIRDVLKRGLVV